MGTHSPGLAALTSHPPFSDKRLRKMPGSVCIIHRALQSFVVILAQPESPYLPSFAGLRIHSAISAMNGDIALPEGAWGFSPTNKSN
jgi:hypothetical protein